MKKKNIIICLVIVIAIVILFVFNNKYNLSIKVDLVDSKSPDRILTVYNKNKLFKYDHIEYTDGIYLCSYNNPTVGYVDIKSEKELVIVLKNNKKIKVRLEKD